MSTRTKAEFCGGRGGCGRRAGARGAALVRGRLSGLSLAGCPGTISNPDDFRAARNPTCSLSVDVETGLVAPRCGASGCHDANATSGQLDLVSPNPMSRLV